MKGTVYSGINNVYQIKTDSGEFYQCRIKGKILKEEHPSYNPLSPGDVVNFEPSDSGQGLIGDRVPRRNYFSRWIRKKNVWQILAANIDQLIVVMSTQKPPFRPRFVDRVLLNAAMNDIPALILLNKTDQGQEEWMDERLREWERIGIPVLGCSALTGFRMDDLRDSLGEKTTAFVGPSGVGKSTLINRLVPGLDLPSGSVSEKHSRGRHVTNFGRLLEAPWGGRLVDTPGVREMAVHGIAPASLGSWFPEFRETVCSFNSCTHRREPGCGVLELVESGAVHPDRYQSYLRMFDELSSECSYS